MTTPDNVVRVNFKGRRIMKPHEYDGKTCRNCLEYHEGTVAKAVCLACIRFGHTRGKVDNWETQRNSDEPTNI